MASSSTAFCEAFQTLTGHSPFPWQERLFTDWFAKGQVPPSCNLPTGLGKTAVIAVWLIARANGADVPRRLVYVVNRRTVVDQTTNEAMKLRKNASQIGIDNLAISTLRGQFADNQEWSVDPSRPAVICGTVDMIGSRLLFSGYRIGFRSRPLHAGFLGQDTLLVHDEAHLEPAFQTLITDIEKEQQREREFAGDLPWPKLRVMQLTATTRSGTVSRTESQEPFELSDKDRTHPVVRQRIEAMKSLVLTPVADDKQVADKIAELALKRRKDKDGNDTKAAVLIFVRTLDQIGLVTAKLTNKKDGVPKEQVQPLTGTIRGLERDHMADPRWADASSVFARFLQPPKPDVPEDEQWKIEPMPGTVYLVCTSAGEVGIDISADHMVCDLSTFESMAQRFGRVNRFGDCDDTRIDVVYPKDFDEKDKLTPARQATLNLLKQLNKDASPWALSSLDADACKAAFAPEPTILPATYILFDAWALTTIRDKMPGRPPVEPYLHGVTEWEPPRTSVAWRKEVEHITDELVERYGDDFPQILLDDYPLKPRELLSDTSERVFKALEVIAKRTNDSYPLWIVGERGQVEVSSLSRLLKREKKQVIRLISDCTILLPPTMGGLRDGMLDGTSEYADDVADQPEHPSEGRIRKVRMGSTEPADESEIVGMRLVRSIELDPDEEDGAARRVWEWYKLKPLEDTRTAQKPVEFGTHVGDVECRVRQIIAGLSLPDEIAEVILLAARLHDHGKQRERFQVALNNRCYPDLLLAKSGRRGTRLPEPFRHEFASLMDATNDVRVQRLSPLMQDLVLHLIAAHHGRARPHFPTDEVFDPEHPATAAEELALEVPRRFAHLQRKYGRWGLAYLESLLRAADWAASAEPSQFTTETEEVSP
jgi:CRISPR-associated endonuclease/helicase Cas3